MPSLFVIPAIPIFLLGCFIEYVANPQLEERYLLVPFPLVALVLGFLELFLFEPLRDLFLTSSLMSGFGWTSSNLLEASFLAAIVLNLVILVSVAVAKLVYLFIARRYSESFGSIASEFYRRSEEREGWFLLPEMRGVRTMFRSAWVATIVVSCVLMLLAFVVDVPPAFAAFVCPAYATALVSEIYFALSGETEPEYKDRIGVEDDEAQRVYDYAALVAALRHYFADRLLHLHSKGRSGIISTAHEDFYRSLLVSDDPATRLAGEYCQAMVTKGLLTRDFDEGGFDELDHDMALAMVRLLHGQSVLVATAFFHDYLPYVFFPVVSRLMRGEHVLVVVGPEVGEQSLRHFLREGLAFVSGDADLWTVGFLGHRRDMAEDAASYPIVDTEAVAAPEPPDLGILSFSDLLDAPTVLSLEDYLEDVTLTLILDSSGLLSTYQIGLSLLAETLSRGTPSSYCVFDRNHDGLVDALSQTLRETFTEVVATELASSSSVGMFWEADGEQLQQRLVGGVARNLGFGTELGLVSLREGVDKVTWASASAVPLADQRWIDGQYFGGLMEFARLPLEQRSIDDHVEFVHDVWAIPKRTHRYLIVEDEECNLFEAYRQYATRASEQAFVNVIAPNYLLRSYMVAHAELFTGDPKAIPAFAPAFAPSPRNAAHAALMLMMASADGTVEEDELRRRLAFMGIECVDCQRVLGELIDEYVNGDERLLAALPRDRVYGTPYEAYDSATKSMVTRRHFALEGREAYEEVFRELRAVPIVIELPDNASDVLGSHLYCHAYQSFLPGQRVTIRGEYYVVNSISPTKGVVLERAADHFDRRHYYRQLVTLHVGRVGELSGEGSVRTISGIRASWCQGDFAVETRGYLDLEDFGDVTSGHEVLLEDVPMRRYKAKRILKLTFENTTQPQLRSLALVLSEVLVTLFPKDHAYLRIVVPEIAPDASDEIPGYSAVLPGYEGPEDPDSIYIVEDSLLDIGLVNSFDRNLTRILSIVYAYLDWLGEAIKESDELSDGQGIDEAERVGHDVRDVEGTVKLDPSSDDKKAESSKRNTGAGWTEEMDKKGGAIEAIDTDESDGFDEIDAAVGDARGARHDRDER